MVGSAITMLAANTALDKWTDWEAYPESWPTKPQEKLPLGVVPLDPSIRASAERRLAAIKHDFAHAGSLYPREEVRAALAYWHIAI
jgi:hypothetical protein